jgi:hypothetical protein
LAVNELFVNLSPYRVDHRYFKVFVGAPAFVAPVLSKLFAVNDSLSVSIELNAYPIPHWNAVFHVEEELLHGDRFGSGMSGEPFLVSKKPAQGVGGLAAIIPLRVGRKRPGEAEHLATQFKKFRHGV